MASSSSSQLRRLRRLSAHFRRRLLLIFLLSAAASPPHSASSPLLHSPAASSLHSHSLISTSADGGDDSISHGASAGGSSTARYGTSARRARREEEEEDGENDGKGLDLAGRRGNVAAAEISGGGMMKALYETIPAAPVEGQAKSCALDLSDELLGGVRAACMKGKKVERRRCCPVLAAWLMAARSRTALHPPLLQSAEPPLDGGGATTLPLLPDDSLVCIASLKSALAARGIHLNPPNASCDVVTCVCGIRLNHLSAQSCPLPFFWRRHGKGFSAAAAAGHRNASSEKEAAITVNFPLQPSAQGIPPPPPPPPAGLSELLQALATNCTDHSYRGCTRCLRTLRKEVSSKAARDAGIVAANASSGKTLNCELIGLMWLLEVNKTFYIPTVSAVVRALMYGDHPWSKSSPTCSPDTENMPLALDYSEILSAAVPPSTSPAPPPPPIFAPAAAAAALLLLLHRPPFFP